MKKVIARKEVDIRVIPGDKIRLSYDSGHGPVGILEEGIDESLHVAECGAFKFDREFGCKKGVGGYFGEK